MANLLFDKWIFGERMGYDLHKCPEKWAKLKEISTLIAKHEMRLNEKTKMNLPSSVSIASTISFSITNVRRLISSWFSLSILMWLRLINVFSIQFTTNLWPNSTTLNVFHVGLAILIDFVFHWFGIVIEKKCKPAQNGQIYYREGTQKKTDSKQISWMTY